jgi:AcrR family transcriptional regulator
MNKSPVRRRGRPRGIESATRDQILAAARCQFLAVGYDRATMRGIAAEAGVDAALLSYFFGSKRGLFGAAMALTTNPAEVVAQALPGDLQQLPDRLLRALLAVWDDPTGGAALRALAEAAVREPETARLIREAVGREVLGRIVEHIGGADAGARVAVLSTQIVGVIFARYVLKLEPVASLPADELRARLVPAFRATLFGPPPRRQAER